ncbi:YggT family protein [Clostridium sp. USBA 49]|jgi:YggT family protein|uniref:YggT family protein n=1 Tax=Clostridium TaxID=1485 RepID=UPI0009992FFE|nr:MULTISPECIES: YggT family protein [Clostridium]SKA76969.1 YggT family protein [Clostridium sp. USBA 49]
MINNINAAVNILFSLLQDAIVIEALLSWIYRGSGNVFTDILHTITEPFLVPARKITYKLFPNMMLDFSPIIALFIIRILQFIINALLGMFING